MYNSTTPITVDGGLACDRPSLLANSHLVLVVTSCSSDSNGLALSAQLCIEANGNFHSVPLFWSHRFLSRMETRIPCEIVVSTSGIRKDYNKCN